MDNLKGKWFLLLILGTLFSCSENEVIPPVDDKPEALDGKYVGGWTSTTQTTSFSNFPISMDVVLNANKTNLSGDFYATATYSSCCNSGASDGRISMTIDGDSILSFSLNTVIPNCAGAFSGAGEIKESGNLILVFTGNDCDGDHVGQLVFRK